MLETACTSTSRGTRRRCEEEKNAGRKERFVQSPSLARSTTAADYIEIQELLRRVRRRNVELEKIGAEICEIVDEKDV